MVLLGTVSSSFLPTGGTAVVVVAVSFDPFAFLGGNVTGSIIVHRAFGTGFVEFRGASEAACCTLDVFALTGSDCGILWIKTLSKYQRL